MDVESKNNIIVYIFMLISLAITVFVIPQYSMDVIRLANIIIWGIIFVFSMKIPNEHNRFKALNENIKTIIMILIIYYILYFLLGIIVGYKNSPYSLKIITLLKNIFFYVGLVLLQEYTRAKLVNSTRNYSVIIFTTCIFIFFNIDFEKIGNNFVDIQTGFEYIVSVIIPIIAKNALLTYLAMVGGYQLSYSYKIPVTLITILLPFFPNVDWFLLMGLELLLVYIIFIFLNYEHNMRIKRYTREELKESSPFKNIPLIIVILLLVLFIAGFFPYRPVALISNSMYPYIKRGDIAVVKKLNEKQVDCLQVGQIVEYNLDKNMVIHRITKVGKDMDGNVIFTTKGDNNDSEDAKKVTEQQVIGEVKFIIKYLGYPSVWFSEIVLSKSSRIET